MTPSDIDFVPISKIFRDLFEHHSEEREDNRYQGATLLHFCGGPKVGTQKENTEHGLEVRKIY